MWYRAHSKSNFKMLLGDKNISLCVYFSQCVRSFLLVCYSYHLEKNFCPLLLKNCVFGNIPSVLKGLLLGDGCVFRYRIFQQSGCNHEANCGTGFDSSFPITSFFWWFFFSPSSSTHIKKNHFR